VHAPNDDPVNFLHKFPQEHQHNDRDIRDWSAATRSAVRCCSQAACPHLDQILINDILNIDIAGAETLF
jgi:hypothetical protein